MKRILCIVSAMNTGGAETFMMKIYRALDKSKYQMDFCVSEKEKGFYDDEIYSLGGKIFYIPPKSKNPLKNFIGIKNLVKKENYKYVMRIGQDSLIAVDLLSAKLGGAKRLVLRSSNSNTNTKIGSLTHKIFSFLPRILPDVKIAPSTEAAEFVFGKKAVKNNKVTYLNNAICVEDFIFDSAVRNSKRAQLGLNDNFVVGHIGRFNYQKNHQFLLKVFYEVKKHQPNSVLLLIGDGGLKKQIEQQAKELNLIDSIKFLGVRSDIPELLMAMDVMLFPSFYEGMPNTIIEAQASGLQSVISDTITREANIVGLVEYVSLKMPVQHWADIVIKYNNEYSRLDYTKEFSTAGYSIKDAVKRFERIVFEE